MNVWTNPFAKNLASGWTPRDPGLLRDEELQLVLESTYPGEPARGWVPYYEFGIWAPEGRAGSISLRVGNVFDVIMYYGHIGYGVDARFRGHHYAARSCKLLLPLAREHGMTQLWITCNPDNLASRRTCELVGAHYVETVAVPRYSPLWRQGETSKCRYRWDVAETPPVLN